MELGLLMGKHKRLWHEREVLCAVLGPHPSEMFVHAVLSSDFGGLWPVVDFLELTESLIND